MIGDELAEFCDATALNTGGAASYLLGDVMDLGTATAPILDIGQFYFVVTVDTTATSGGSATGAFTLASDAQAAIAVDGSATVHFVSPAIAVATLVAGYTAVSTKLPPGKVPIYERYLGVLQTTAVAAFTAGKINAFLTRDAAIWRAYADASN